MVDFTKQHELRAYIMETTGGPAAGGLTVRDVFACTAMGSLLETNNVYDGMFDDCAEMAYKIADAMLEARITLPKAPCTVEEAFGL